MDSLLSEFDVSQGRLDPILAVVNGVYNQDYLHDFLHCTGISHSLLDQFRPENKVTPKNDIFDVELCFG